VSYSSITLRIASGSGGHGESGVFPPFDSSTYPSQIFWLVLTFGLLLFLLSKVLLPRVGNILEERSNRIADDLDTAARMQREAELAGKAYEKALADARAKAHNVAETTRAGVTAELEAEMARAEEETQAMLDKAEAKIRKMREQALANVEDISVETTGTLLEHVFGKKPGVAKIRKAVKAFD